MKQFDRISFFGLAIIALLFLAGCAATEEKYSAAAGERTRVIIYVWDGLRPDSVNPQDTPNLYQMRQAGVDFSDNHSTYPTFTMMNAASFATGGFPGSTGFYGNTLWEANASGKDAANKPVDFRQPVFTEDYAILEDLNQYLKGDLLLVGTLFDAAQKAGLTTAAVGKSGAAYIQDYKRGGMLLDEKTVLPLSLAQELQSAGISLPTTTPNAFPPGALALAPDNGNPIDIKAVKKLKDGVTFDPTDSSGSPYKPGLKYLADTYINYILPKKNPKLTVFWLRNPDTTQHVYGVGGPNYRDALRDNDRILGQLRAKLKELGQDGSTDIIVVSDHAHSNVAGASDLFPLRAIRNGAIDEIDPNGYSVSGLVRLADLLNRAGFVVYDGQGCSYLPGGVGIKIDGTSVYPTKIDRDGSICGKPGEKYMTASFKVPTSLPPKAIVIAVNGGSDYLYVPDHDAETVRNAVRFLQSRSEVGAIFVDSRYGQLPGTLPLGMVRAENAAGRNPDIIASFDYDEYAVITGVSGTEYSGTLLNTSYRGMHGSFSPLDVHNTLIAYGPDFRESYVDTLPTGNVDVAPTVATILGLSLVNADGRPLLEALRHGPPDSDYQVVSTEIEPASAATGLTIALPTDPNGNDIDPSKSSYSIELQIKALGYQGKNYTYFDYAKAIRQ